ncbi:sugar transferase [Pediococcus acidilactici]|uniref:sugar transferase n=1 Tax=Pediococcus acidilactici TaxID=1254 RepID=UPI0025A67C59|nr:sugar transferase [Pediococcus acidilactici]MDM5041843.1 sugar transferase [Pediococcus acidilactici]
MKKYVLSLSAGQSNTAGQKAKQDITKILKENGYEQAHLVFPKSKILRFFLARKIIKKMIKNINVGDIFVVQYPIYSRYGTDVLLKQCKQKGIKTICFIHDVESLRLYKNDTEKINQELKLLKKFSCLVVHNNTMKSWLMDNGVNIPMVSLELFDYCNEQKLPTVSKNKDLVFAGNLAKSKFLEKWNLNVRVKLFGIEPSEKYSSYIKYMGVKSPNDLPRFLDGSFGLVWDGDSLDTNSGIYGEYTKYNNPHKVSLYLSCGLPVIVWKNAAIARFVEKNNLGITISSIQDIKEELNKIDDQKYNLILENVREVSKKVRDGWFTVNAVNKAIEKI